MKDINIFMNTTGFYVYVYRDIENNNTPFYVGKGIKNRYCDVGSRKYNKHLYNKIYQLRRKGYKVRDFTTIEKDGMTAEHALNFEIELIKKWGRRDLNTGILLNMTDGGDGVINIKHNPILLNKKDEIFKMYDMGKTLKEIANIYNCSNISPVLYLFRLFDKKCRRSGISKPDIDYIQLKVDFINEMTINQLSKKYKCDHQFIKKYLKAEGFDIIDGRKTSKLRGGSGKSKLDEHITQILELYEQQKSIFSIARHFNVDSCVIRNILNKKNIKIRDGRKINE